MKLDTTEFVTLDGKTREGPRLPIHVWGHCFVQLNENEFMLAGGVSNEHYSSSITYIYNRLDDQWTQGPDMTIDRYLHKCSTFKSDAHGGRNIVVAAGGYSILNGMMKSAEIYDHMEPEKGWQSITDMPLELAQFSMITSPIGNGIIASGGINGSDRQTAIYEMTCPESGCVWNKLEQQIKFARMDHITMLIPDSMTTCE